LTTRNTYKQFVSILYTIHTSPWVQTTQTNTCMINMYTGTKQYCVFVSALFRYDDI